MKLSIIEVNGQPVKYCWLPNEWTIKALNARLPKGQRARLKRVAETTGGLEYFTVNKL